jgi:molecular chaperone DnaK (HSP70)
MRMGIDFGTTRTVVACADRGNYPVIGFHDEAGDAVEWIPSLAAARDGELAFGFDAARAAAADPSWTLLRSFKRLLAGSDAALDRELDLGGTRVSVLDLLTGFLRSVREAATRRAQPGARGAARDTATEAVIAVPANAPGTQRFLTMEAFRRAGFQVLAMLNEPSAAGFEYTHRYRQTLTARREHVVVYDLGGGTFDASLVRMNDRCHEVEAAAGLNHLGGDDFDAILEDLVAAARPGVRRTAALRERCREAKERLSANARRVVVDTDEGEVAIPAADYWEACAPLIERTLATMAPVMSALPDEDAGLAGIYVVGGASALPPVGRRLRERWGRRVHRSPYPFAAVAIGLAIAADESSGYKLADRFSRCFGVFREARGGREVAFDPIFAGEVALARGGEVARSRTYRAAHNLGHFRFVECGAVSPSGAPDGDVTPVGDLWFPFDATLRARRDLDAVPVVRLPGDGPLIEEQYVVDENGMVRVTITDLECGYQREYRLGAA